MFKILDAERKFIKADADSSGVSCLYIGSFNYYERPPSDLPNKELKAPISSNVHFYFSSVANGCFNSTGGEGTEWIVGWGSYGTLSCNGSSKYLISSISALFCIFQGLDTMDVY